MRKEGRLPLWTYLSTKAGVTRAEVAIKEKGALVPIKKKRSEAKKGMVDGKFSLGKREEVFHDLPFLPKGESTSPLISL